MKLQRPLLFIAIPLFALLITVPLFVKADDATSTFNIILSDITATSTDATSTIADATSTTFSSTTPLLPVSINFDVEGPSSTLASDNNLFVPPCTTPISSSSTLNGFCAFAVAGAVPQVSWSTYGAFVTAINGVSEDANNFWLWFLNGDPAQDPINGYILKPGDSVLWTLGREPLKISVSTTTPAVNATTTVTVLGFNPVNFDFEPLAGASVTGALAVTDANGKANIVATSTNPFTVSANANGFLPSKQFTITPRPQRVILTIVDGNTKAFSGSVVLPDSEAANILVTPTNNTTSVAVSLSSVLGLLESVEASSSNFSITNLQYYSPSAAFPNGSFLVNCILVPLASSTPDCNNWHDTINGLYPDVGVDQQKLQDGDNVYLFFSSNPTHQTVLSKNSVLTGESFTATAEQFDPQTNTYKPLTGVILGVGTPNDKDYTFTELTTLAVNSSGQAIFKINIAGTFAVGIKEDYYFPTVPITITDATSTPQSGSGNGSGSMVNHSTFNIPSALAFISGSQNPDGSFDSPYSTDWTAIAFASAGMPGLAKTKLHNYLVNTAPALASLTDYERHAMALEAMDINPYSGTAVNYIDSITNAFGGTQMGTANNNYIFALLALEHAGFTYSDSEIQKAAAFLLLSQNSDGSWDGTPDMTAAAMQGLGPLFDIAGVNSALGKAAGYLKSTQNTDGGWGNVDSTSWVQTAINGIIEAHALGLGSENAWTSSNGLFPTDALAAAQKPDGGIDVPANRVWSTGYAVAASSGKSWTTILSSFPKLASSDIGGSTAVEKVLGTSTAATNIQSDRLATTTPEIATTTLELFPFAINANKAIATTITMPKTKFRTALLKIEKNTATAQNSTFAQPKQQVQTTTALVSDKVNFFERIWRAVIYFFSHLF